MQERVLASETYTVLEERSRVRTVGELGGEGGELAVANNGQPSEQP